ncbi:hypothetical protein [Saccharospirillum sp.]|uniref:hypothetical protein n=1 Tax=Saccharospirillum sp. TaxID=2033801 RepID=UPI0034A08C4B
MAVNLFRNGINTTYSYSEFKDNEFILENNGSRINFKSPLELDPSFDNKEFDIHFLAKKNIIENEIFQVFLNTPSKKRVGWLIPAISLNSTDHDYSTNQHFLKYAFAAIKEILQSTDEQIFRNHLDSDQDDFTITDLLHESTAILIISNETLDDTHVFDIDRASPSLVKRGYIKLGQFNPDDIKLEIKSKDNNGKFYVDLLSKEINGYELISELLNSSVAFEKKPVFQFFLIYQVFELLIDDIFKNEQDKLIAELNNCRYDTGKSKEVLGKIQNYSSEKKRMELLVYKYSMRSDRMDDLKLQCNQLLGLINRDTEHNFQGYFYNLRNFIFHQYRDFPESGNSTLEELISTLLEVLSDILATYKVPSS